MEQIISTDALSIVLIILLVILAILLILAIVFFVYAIRMLKNLYVVSKTVRGLGRIVNEDLRNVGGKLLKDENIKKIIKSALLWGAGFLRVLKKKRRK